MNTQTRAGSHTPPCRTCTQAMSRHTAAAHTTANVIVKRLGCSVFRLHTLTARVISNAYAAQHLPPHVADSATQRFRLATSRLLIHSANLAAEVDAEDEISAGDAGDDGAWQQPVGPSCLCASVSSKFTKIIWGSGSTAQHRLWFLRSFCLAGVRCRCNVCCVQLCSVVLCCDIVQF